MVDELIENCITATREGADFPTVWQTLLRRRSLVVGPPIQGIESGRICLKIPLISSQWLIYDSTSKEFSSLRHSHLIEECWTRQFDAALDATDGQNIERRKG
jgi:hypothetical protein